MSHRIQQIARLISENIDDLDYDFPQTEPEFEHPHDIYCYEVELGLFDENGNYSANGKLFDITNDEQLPDSLNFLIPMLQTSKDYYGKLYIDYYENNYLDNIDIISANLILGGRSAHTQEINIPEYNLDDLHSGFIY